MYKKSINYLSAAAFSIFLIAASLSGQTSGEMKQSLFFEKEAAADYKEKNFSGFLKNIFEAEKLRPNHPRLIYNLGAGFALNDKKEDALRNLERLARMGLYFPFEKDEDFNSLFNLPEFKVIRERSLENKTPLNKSEKAFSINQKDLIAEGIAFDPKDKRFFVSSVHRRKIIAVDENKNVSDFSRETDGLWSALGMRVDEKRQILWVCSTAFPQMRGFEKEDEGRSGIFKYDLRSGKLLKKYLLSASVGEKHALGDLIIGRNGDVFATDSVSPRIYRIDYKTDALEVFLESDSFFSLQGLTFSPDEKHLFVADYSKGVSKIDLKTKQIKQITPADDVTALGIDGLYFHKGNLIAIQNGVNPNRIVRLNLDKDQTKIISFDVLEANHESFNEPTLGVIRGDEFFFIANSQWNLVDKKGLLDEEKLVNPQILKLKL